MYNKLHYENVQLKAQILTLRMENAEFIGKKSKLDSILTCDECDERFERKEDINEHIMLKHQVNFLSCDIC